jgi:hypothetical protein
MVPALYVRTVAGERAFSESDLLHAQPHADAILMWGLSQDERGSHVAGNARFARAGYRKSDDE